MCNVSNRSKRNFINNVNLLKLIEKKEKYVSCHIVGKSGLSAIYITNASFNLSTI